MPTSLDSASNVMAKSAVGTVTSAQMVPMKNTVCRLTNIDTIKRPNQESTLVYSAMEYSLTGMPSATSTSVRENSPGRRRTLSSSNNPNTCNVSFVTNKKPDKITSVAPHRQTSHKGVNKMIASFKSLSLNKYASHHSEQLSIQKGYTVVQETVDKCEEKNKHCRSTKRKVKHHLPKECDQKGVEELIKDTGNTCRVTRNDTGDYIEDLEVSHLTQKYIEHLPDIESNVTKGPFSSIEHYVSVQLNLLLHDIIEPFQEGINILAASGTTKKVPRLTQLKVYKNATFMKYDVKTNKFGIRVKFDENKSICSGSNFLQGSLLAFSKDKFNNYFFATVLDYNKRGEVTVKLCQELLLQNLKFDKFVMVESEIFFTPYFYVMKALQSLSHDNFPMKSYIVDVNCTRRPPAYLLNKKVNYKIGHKSDVPVLDLDSVSWPNAEELHMDPSQYTAFRSALVQEFVLVQGPPGTGKTYLGLKLAEVLLNNANIWNTDNRPILVVCFTNHALDQFLEGMISFTEELIRMGGQSQSKLLVPYNLKAKKKKMNFWGFSSVKRDISEELKISSKVLQLVVEDLTHIKMNLGVISFSCFESQGIVSFQHTRSFKSHATNFVIKSVNEQVKQDAVFVSWLFNYEANANNFNQCKEMIEETEQDVKQEVYETQYLSLMYAVTIAGLEKKIVGMKQIMYRTLTSPGDESEKYSMLWLLEEEHSVISRGLETLNSILSTNIRGSAKQIDRLLNQSDLWELDCHKRWMLYNYWVDQVVDSLKHTQMNLLKILKTEEQNYEDVLTLDNVGVLQTSLIVGMTTTGAARNQPLLQKLKPKIVIVEEAAEVLESHVLASLTAFCEHLILIGDHNQLQPHVNVYKLKVRYGLNISLFERMVRNEMYCDILKVQRRMRPEIASLITPSIYPDLVNHTSVYDFPDVKGITSNVYFISHSVPEDMDISSTSHLNIHESEFLIHLCRHIVLQGYKPSQITLLTMYKAQMFHLTKGRDKISMLRQVNVKTVDDFQGEENTIILLSLVRSNSDANIGFLRTENRVCVALSRAREGLYIIGNMQNLTCRSSFWTNVQDTLMKQNSVGKKLTLRCERHPKTITRVSTARDFDMVPEGGCNVPCLMVLKCGHTCIHKCHVIDMDHEDRYKCVSDCEKVICDKGHKCQKACWMNCGKCMQLIWTDLPCDHKIQQPCSLVTTTCPLQCMKVHPCGHNCLYACHYFEPECGECRVIVEKEHPRCGHKERVHCHVDMHKASCIEPCPRKLKCGHQCQSLCGDPCENCKEFQWVIGTCGHKIYSLCNSNQKAEKCQELCEKTLPCGHKCKSICCEPCTETCMEPGMFRFGSCGHMISAPCHKNELMSENSEELLAYCQSPCGMQLECGHKCGGKCCECLQGRIHKKCMMRCGRLLLCGHSCDSVCFINCPPCTKEYLHKCAHAEKMRGCFKPLPVCTEPCTWQCEHYQCTKICSGPCDRPPCNEPCEKTLPCGHPCIGFCGDVCPPLCRVCDSVKFDEALGDGSDYRFVYLVDCKHVIQHEELQLKITEKDSEVLMKSCPLCETAIVNTQRYRNYLKSHTGYECAVKNKIFNLAKDLRKKKKETIAKLSVIQMRTSNVKYKETMSTVIQRNQLNKTNFCFDGEVVQLQANILTQMSEEWNNIFECKDVKLKEKCMAYFESLLRAINERVVHISEQEIKDFQMELTRLQRISLMCRVANDKSVQEGLKDSLFNMSCSMVLCPKKYSSTDDDLITLFLLNVNHVFNIPDEMVRKPKQIKLEKIKGVCEGYWFKADVIKQLPNNLYNLKGNV